MAKKNERTLVQIAGKSLRLARNSPKGLAKVRYSETVYACLRLLIDEGVTPRHVLERLAHSQLSEGFFPIVHDIYRQIGGFSLTVFEDAVMTSPNAFWTGRKPRFTRWNLDGFFSKVRSRKRILKTHRGRIFNSRGPFFAACQRQGWQLAA